MVTFTTIQHCFRKRHNLSFIEYVFLDIINFLSNKSDNKTPGWCSVKKDELAKEIGVTKQGLFKLINRLITDDFLTKDHETKYIKTTPKWQEVYFENTSKQSLPEVNSVAHLGKLSLPDSLNINNNINNREKNFYASLVPYVSQYGKQMIREFYEYWTEKNTSGKKMRFEMKDVFDISKRLARWKINKDERAEKYQKANKQEPIESPFLDRDIHA